MFSSPCNPSGSVYSKEELAALAEVFRKHPRIVVLSDEIYEYINYVGAHQSIAQFDFLKDRVVVVNGLSKGYAMTGWRLGYIAAPLELAKAVEKIQGQFTSGTCSITQRAAIHALLSDPGPSHDMVREFEKRKNFIVKAVSDIPGVEVDVPDGAFYIFPDVSSFFGKKADGKVIENADDLCMYLLEKGLVSTVTGSAFGEPTCIRMSYAASMEKLQDGVDRISRALAALN
jgi:aspartate aminotransferase